MKSVIIHTDGGCEGNPGPGGWGAVLRFGAHVRELSGGEPATTNNRMELSSAIAALDALKEPCEVELFTDSTYLRDGITKHLAQWKARGWKLSTKKPVKNADLWRALDAATARHRVTWRWVRGHAGNVDNERCDVLAGVAIAAIRRRHSREELTKRLADFKSEREGASAEPGLFGA